MKRTLQLGKHDLGVLSLLENENFNLLENENFNPIYNGGFFVYNYLVKYYSNCIRSAPEEEAGAVFKARNPA